MFDIFGTIKSLIKIETTRIDNNVFRLHYRVTVLLLIAFSIIVNSRQYFGDPIDCTATSDSIARVIDNYCWIHSYLTLPKEDAPEHAFSEEHDVILPHYGVREETPWTINKYQRYYQWVGFGLFIQAAFFFIPRYFWKYYWEGGRIKCLVAGLTTSFVPESEYEGKIKLILNYIKANTNQNRIYAFSFFFCEFLNLVNVICQIFITDWFLGYEFSNLGFKLISTTETIPGLRNDILNLVFPKIAKCDFSTHGTTGDIATLPSICVLPVNTFNEKIYVVLWFWFIILAVVSCLHLLYTAVLIFVPKLRSIQLRRSFRIVDENPWDEPTPAQIEKKNESEGRPMSDDEILEIVSNVGVGDWFLVYLLGKNMDPLIYGRMVREYARLLKSTRASITSDKGLNSKGAVHRNSSFEVGKRGSFLGVGIGGGSAPHIQQ